MRASLASSIAVACAAALALPVTLAAPATATARPAAAALPPAQDELPGSTQSLPLRPLGSALRSFGTEPGAAAEQGLTRRDVRPFSLVGVVWDDPSAVLHGTVQVRTRAAADGVWSEWQDVETHNEEHGADPATAEGAAGTLRGSTAPLWVGDSDGVEIRVRAGQAHGDHGDHAAGDPSDRAGATAPLPAGLRLELVDPGEDPAAPAPGTRAMAPPAALTAAEAAATGVNSQLAPYGATAIPATAAEETQGTPVHQGTPVQQAAPGQETAKKKPYIGPRPKIITRKGWGADESIREKGFVYTKTIKAAFVHHSATGNNYTCGQAPSVLRSIYRYHVKSSGWRDFGYNFTVDKCGNIYEGRAGGVAKPVLGAHTLGFNTNSMGIAVLGTFTSTNPPAAVVTAVARLTAWKLGLHGINPKGTQTLVSGGGGLYKKGRKVTFHTIAGHRDGFATECPGGRLYGKLGTARASSAKYQGRS
ncbi:N-acetylmuramoyl-L-alanine amidase [Streptomyces roseofulvus]|uniref:N-acetylmuramoyl-L-alanine amidase n=2 Tax=Streptomyces TaxID=1883 RepID=A0ABU4KBI3_9ACTN|nr:N-acetylmuramoyl-L-alanine amidase [Streptomyces roseolus]MDX2294685.1 N-acetylmuramoyl-L-alanine amidase [Streptomyces roseolus]